MKKQVKSICVLLIVFCVFLMSAVVYGFYALPDTVHSLSNEKIDLGLFYSCTVDGNKKTVSKSVIAEGEYHADVKLFNAIPVKSTCLKVNSRPYVVASGEIIGLRLFTKGVMIVGVQEVATSSGNCNPVKTAGLQKGDVILKLDGKNVISSTQVESVITQSGGRSLEVDYSRNGKISTTKVTPVYCESEGKFKTGLWIRDSAAGIGTMTFYDKKSGFFACLGHAVCDVDTGEILPLSDGDIVDAQINGCVKGKSGCAGELCGSFKSSREGLLCLNDSTGVYGVLENPDVNSEEIPVAAKSEIRTGKAEIISTVEGENKSRYSINIEKLNPDDKEDKNIIIKITDEKLIEKTGGIVQGMSGSPIIQDGYLVGAVTHVFVGDPTKGYGIFAESMLEKAEELLLPEAG